MDIGTSLWEEEAAVVDTIKHHHSEWKLEDLFNRSDLRSLSVLAGCLDSRTTEWLKNKIENLPVSTRGSLDGQKDLGSMHWFT